MAEQVGKTEGSSSIQVGEARILGPRVGWIAGFRAGDGTLVDFVGNTRGPQAARTTLPLGAAELQQALSKHQGVVLLFEEGEPTRPLIMGLLQENETPYLDLILDTRDETGDTNLAAEQVPEPPTEVRVDGRRVLLEGQDEIVLRCGRAAITLQRNGKIVIRGTYLVSRSEGTNRIKGGSVQIN